MWAQSLNSLNGLCLFLWHYPSLYHVTEYQSWWENNISSVVPLPWVIFHIFASRSDKMGGSCWRRSQFLVKWGQHSPCYPTLVPVAMSLRDQGVLLISSYIYGQASVFAGRLLLISSWIITFCVGSCVWVWSTGVQCSETIMVWKACSIDYAVSIRVTPTEFLLRSEQCTYCSCTTMRE